jgi:hypothetical protein
MTEVLDTRGWKFYAVISILLIAAIILLAAIGYPLLSQQATPVPGSSQPAPNKTIVVTPVPVRITPTVTVTLPAPSGTIHGVTMSLPSSTQAPSQTSMPPTTAIKPVPFSLSVTPQSASAKPGDILTYTLAIQHGEGMTDPIHMSLTAKVLFITQTYDLGALDPPFPKSIRYDFTVPGNLPSGVTVNGVITATGGAQTESEDITLNIL